MLEDIQIKNFALINSASLEFSNGFTVLSGETGAGKSILIEAVSFLLGGKSSASFVREGAKVAQVSGTIYIDRNRTFVLQWLKEHGIEIENDRILLRRIIRKNGKSTAWIEDTPVTRGELSDLTSWLIDMHGQHEHQSLMRVHRHRNFLDAYAEIEKKVAKFTKLYTELVEKRESLKQMNVTEQDRIEKIDLLEFSIKEIEEAKINPSVDDTLEEEENKLSQFEKLYSDIEEINQVINGIEKSHADGALTLLKRTNTLIAHAKEMDASLVSLSSRIESVFYEVSDIANELRAYSENLVFDPHRLQEIQDRNAELYRLKKKHSLPVHSSANVLLEYVEKARQQLNSLKSSEEDKKTIVNKIKDLERTLYAQAVTISKERQNSAGRMSELVKKALQRLGMNGTKFEVRVVQKKSSENKDDIIQSCGPYGIDDVEFLLSANPGSPLKPLAKIASGGEMSRVMLALKTVLNEADTVDTLIFDEIDAGIGGEVAVAVGKHLKDLSVNKQILCITHLASIAVYADTQIKIEKSVQNNDTITSVLIVKEEERVQEIARMLSGNAVNEVSLEHARTLLQKHC